MSDIYSITAAALADGRQRLETTSLNAASSTLPGYRRQVPLSRPFQIDPQGAASATAAGRREAPSPSASAGVDLRPGQLISTGRALDLSIEGDNLFFGLTDGQQVWLTRAGSFHLSADGRLIGERGLRVLGTDGELRLDSADVEVAADGRILHDGQVVASIQLFRADEPLAVRAAGGSLLQAGGGFHAAEGGTGRLRSGALEGSNAQATQVMFDLMTVSRQYESLVRVTQHYDELLGRTIQKLGEV